MKKFFLLLLTILIIAAAYFGWKIYGSRVHTTEDKILYIKTGAGYDTVETELISRKIIPEKFWFSQVAQKLGYTKNIKPGRYEIKDGMSVIGLVRMLRNGNQSPVSFTINKIRTKEDLAKLVGKKFECDSLAMINYMNNSDSLKKFGVDTISFMTKILPATYSYFWTSQPEKIYERLYNESEKFWNEERLNKAKTKGLTQEEVYTVASIVDEESRNPEEKPTIASVYLNRIKTNMPLQADPTIKFALRDFGLRQILFSHLKVESPYNTYRNTGLPPGPICSAQKETLDAVLNAPETDYIYFVANSNLRGTHKFASNYKDHMKFAKEYQAAAKIWIDSVKKAEKLKANAPAN